MTTRASAGGTLLGMLVALVIIGILAAVAMPVWSEAVIRMRRGEAQAALQELMQQQERHFTRFNSYVAFSADSDSDFRWWSGRNASSSAYELEGKACDGQEIRDCVQLVAKPGTPISSACPRPNRQIESCSTTWCWPTITRPNSRLSRAYVSRR